MDIIITILSHKLIAFKLRALAYYASTAAGYHVIPL
jgi:hypothetical protein